LFGHGCSADALRHRCDRRPGIVEQHREGPSGPGSHEIADVGFAADPLDGDPLSQLATEEIGGFGELDRPERGQIEDVYAAQMAIVEDNGRLSPTARAESSSGRAAQCTMTRRFCIVPAGATAVYAH
jgi:hypothetical protein